MSYVPPDHRTRSEGPLVLARGNSQFHLAGHGATPEAVGVARGEVYRFSINSAATEEDVDGISALRDPKTLFYLNLSYCAGVPDAALLHLERFPGLRQLFQRGCAHITTPVALSVRCGSSN